MSVFLLTSAAHSPGVTALAVALAVTSAVTSAGPALLVDANREPDQAVLAGYLQGTDPAGLGLGGLLQTHREHRPFEAALGSMLLPLGGDADFLPGFPHPGMVALFTPAWAELAAALDAEPRTVLVDAGRIGSAGLPQPLVDVSTGVLVLVRSDLPSLAALRLYLPQVVESAGEDRVGLVVVGPGRPYTATEIRHRFGVPIWGQVAWQPAAAAVYASGAQPGRRHRASAYLDDVAQLAAGLAERDSGRRVLLGVRP
jgi:hypothetical protein